MVKLGFFFQFLPNRCTPIDEEDFFGEDDRQREIVEEKERLRLISVEEGDTVTLHYKVQ